MRRRVGPLLALALVAVACGGNRSGGIRDSAHPAPGVTDSEIRLGILSDESGPRKAIGLPRVKAARLFFQALNDHGGINGRRVQLVVSDHHFSREIAVEQYLETRQSTLMLEQLYPLAFLNEELARDHILSSPVARFSSVADNPLFVMTGTPYRMEMSNAVDWLGGAVSDPKVIKIAAVTQADDYGADGLTGIEEAATLHDFNLVAKLTYQPTDNDFSAQATALKESGADYVFMTTTSRVSGKLVEGCARIGFTPNFIGSYFSFHPDILAENPALKPLFQKGWKTSGAFAHWGEDVPGMNRMLDAILRHAPEQKPDPFFLHGWIQAGIVAEILKRADEMDSLTRTGLMKALKGMPDIDLGGLSPRLSYGTDAAGPPSRQTRMFETSVDDPRYPDMLKPITEYYVGETAKHARA